MSAKDWNQIGQRMAKRLEDATKLRLIAANSAKGNRITEGLISGVIDAYVEENPHANAVFVSAHQNSIHINEEHPGLIYEDQKPDRDIVLSGGAFSLVGELEISGGPKAVAADFEKIKNDPNDKLKCLATRALSSKQQGRYHGTLQQASEQDGGCYIGIEVRLPKKKNSSEANVTAVCFYQGEKIYGG